uniref:Uncharacterized protein n=1 Tax=Human betaherpesvirus 6 TaxID=10368 RepID=A0A5P9U5H9_9BETA|nr:hypothetical protein [Human betaherpesvirus 6]
MIKNHSRGKFKYSSYEKFPKILYIRKPQTLTTS